MIEGFKVARKDGMPNLDRVFKLGWGIKWLQIPKSSYHRKSIVLLCFCYFIGSFFFAFNSHEIVKKIVQILPPVGIGPSFGLPITR